MNDLPKKSTESKTDFPTVGEVLRQLKNPDYRDKYYEAKHKAYLKAVKDALDAVWRLTPYGRLK